MPIDEPAGFTHAAHLLFCHTARRLVHQRIHDETVFFDDASVSAVHVDTSFRLDRHALTAFDAAGRQIGADTLWVDDPTQWLAITPEFDHDRTGMCVPKASALAELIAAETGWVIDMQVLRGHDRLADCLRLEHQVVLAYLGDLSQAGMAREVNLG